MRTIPSNLSKTILIPLIGNDVTCQTESIYIDKIEKFERKCEKSLIEILSNISIDATVKTDPYSLPYKHEYIAVLYGQGYLNASYQFSRVMRTFVKQILNEDIYKMRFYILIDVVTESDRPFSMGKVVYKLRYYTH